MKRALELAKLGEGFVNPNPLVGAVIVKDGKIIGEGYHARYGEPHAERNAIASLTEDAKGADMYVTLEPCCHYGKQPPCTEAILDAGISRVFIGSQDPNILVSGKGKRMLEMAGVHVETGILKKECDAINHIFFHYITTHTPYVIMKYAMTMDGKIACKTGESKWITGEVARDHVQHTRNRCMAIMIGVGTVIADDPRLTVRLDGGSNPLRVICDSSLRTPLDSYIVNTANEFGTLIAYTEAPDERIRALEEKKVRLLKTPEKDGEVDLGFLMTELGGQGIDSVLLEGGGKLNYSALKAGIVNRVHAYVAPKVFGGDAGYTPVRGLGVDTPDEAFMFMPPTVTAYGEDILLDYEIKRNR